MEKHSGRSRAQVIDLEHPVATELVRLVLLRTLATPLLHFEFVCCVARVVGW